MEVNNMSQYPNNPQYKQSWMQWIQEGATASQALEILDRNGLFHEQYEDQQRGLRIKAFKKGKQKGSDADKRLRVAPTEDPSCQQSQKRARSSSQANSTNWKRSKVIQNWYQQRGPKTHQQGWSQQYHWRSTWGYPASEERASTYVNNPSSTAQQRWPTYSPSTSSTYNNPPFGATSSSASQQRWPTSSHSTSSTSNNHPIGATSSASSSHQSWPAFSPSTSSTSNNPSQPSRRNTSNRPDTHPRETSRGSYSRTDGGRSAGSSTRQQLPDDHFQ
jgi:hypothetical protein